MTDVEWLFNLLIQSRFLLPSFSICRPILHTLVNVQNRSVSIPLFYPLRSKAPQYESGRTL